MPDLLIAVLPGVLSGIAAALGSIAAMKAGMKGLYLRVARLESNDLGIQRSLGRLEGLCAKEEGR